MLEITLDSNGDLVWKGLLKASAQHHPTYDIDPKALKSDKLIDVRPREFKESDSTPLVSLKFATCIAVVVKFTAKNKYMLFHSAGCGRSTDRFIKKINEYKKDEIEKIQVMQRAAESARLCEKNEPWRVSLLVQNFIGKIKHKEKLRLTKLSFWFGGILILPDSGQVVFFHYEKINKQILDLQGKVMDTVPITFDLEQCNEPVPVRRSSLQDCSIFTSIENNKTHDSPVPIEPESGCCVIN
jgi:hypothetical protein